MALIGLFQTVEGIELTDAYWLAKVGGHIGVPLVTVDIYASEQAYTSGRPAVTQLPLGRFTIDERLPTSPQVYAIIKARFPHLREA